MNYPERRREQLFHYKHVPSDCTEATCNVIRCVEWNALLKQFDFTRLSDTLQKLSHHFRQECTFSACQCASNSNKINLKLYYYYYIRWEDNIRMDLEEICINAGNWVDSAQDRYYWRALVNVALNLQVPYAMELVN